jgi:uncharacterized DUF497 family protein
MRQLRRYAVVAPHLAMTGATGVQGGVATRSEAVFQDPDRIEVLDKRDYGEERWVAIRTMGKIVALVVYTARNGGIRLISARKADPDDTADYDARKTR